MFSEPILFYSYAKHGIEPSPITIFPPQKSSHFHTLHTPISRYVSIFWPSFTSTCNQQLDVHLKVFCVLLKFHKVLLRLFISFMLYSFILCCSTTLLAVEATHLIGSCFQFLRPVDSPLCVLLDIIFESAMATNNQVVTVFSTLLPNRGRH